MRELSLQQVCDISAGYKISDWELIGWAGFMPFLSTGIHETIRSGSILIGGKYALACAIPSAAVAGIALGSINLYQYLNS
jgi:hypothetical protein